MFGEKGEKVKMDDNDIKWNAYFIPGTDVLKNKLGITNKEKLLERETEITVERSIELQKSPIVLDFGEAHLRAIHYYLFEKIYEFAGEYRVVYMGKNNSYFANEGDISSRVNMAFQVAEEELKMV